jgi:hypothetical protein
MKSNFLESIQSQFEYYKSLGDNTFEQLTNDDIHWKYNKESNNIAIVVKHIVGNMISRWTNFLNEDGEKEWRQRDTEFIDTYTSKEEMLLAWEKGWECLFNAIKPLEEKDLTEIIYIRNEGHTVMEAINRQLCHYSYHVGQLVYIGKLIHNSDWKTLSIARNKSTGFNNQKFSQEKTRKHFTNRL